MAGSPPVPIPLHAQGAQAYRRLAENLHLALEHADAEEVRTELRKLIERVVFTPLPGKDAFDLKGAGQAGGTSRGFRDAARL